jgi:superoxide dismutase, Cu-Zn family
VHVKPCGRDPLASGGHYSDPEADPSVPLHEREIWLDFTVDENGNGHAKAKRRFAIAEGAASCIVIHAMPTNPDTGMAGARLACTTVPFGSESER